MSDEVRIRQLEQKDLADADRIFRLAFGTFIGLPDPMQFAKGSGVVASRWKASAEGTLCAEIGGEVAGSNFVSNWGSFGFFGPLSVRPDLWEKKIAQRMLDATMALFEKWNCRHTGLYTFSNSAKHIALYMKYGFWPRFLTSVMAKAPAQNLRSDATMFSALDRTAQRAILDECRALTGSIHDGLDVSIEIRALQEQGIGDTLLVIEGSRVAAFAACHRGTGSEAGTDATYVKFAAAKSTGALERLLDACEAYTAQNGTHRLIVGVNLARETAYRAVVRRGFKSFIIGVAMQRPNEAGFNRPDALVLDDWR